MWEVDAKEVFCKQVVLIVGRGCREEKNENCTPGKAGSEVQRSRKCKLYTRKSRFGGARRTKMKTVHQKSSIGGVQRTIAKTS